MLTGQEKPDAARSASGPRVKLAYVDQSRQSLNDKNTVWQEISGGLDMIKVGNYETPSRGYVGRFNFKGTQQQQLIGELSGGERNRVHLAKVLKTGGNVLLLDEPTNDLDVETLRALEEALLAFPGCAVVISHDRWFLDRIATHILAFEGDSQVVWFEGNYQEYAADHERRNGEGAVAAASDQVQEAHSLKGESLHGCIHRLHARPDARSGRVRQVHGSRAGARSRVIRCARWPSTASSRCSRALPIEGAVIAEFPTMEAALRLVQQPCVPAGAAASLQGRRLPRVPDRRGFERGARLAPGARCATRNFAAAVGRIAGLEHRQLDARLAAGWFMTTLDSIAVHGCAGAGRHHPARLPAGTASRHAGRSHGQATAAAHGAGG